MTAESTDRDENVRVHPSIAGMEMPPRMAKLPLNEAGFPIPWFVAIIDGKADFRVVRPNGIGHAFKHRLCWLCGQPMGSYKAFVIGPMCAVNRVSAEPPSHRDCAIYAARACPFLANPVKRRREANKPADAMLPAGEMITRNPGVALVWVTKHFSATWYPDGLLFDVGVPTETLWFAHGRDATRTEVLASIESGLPILQEMADQEGPKATAQLSEMVDRAMALVPS